MELINILLVEDNPADIALTREVFQGCRKLPDKLLTERKIGRR